MLTLGRTFICKNKNSSAFGVLPAAAVRPWSQQAHRTDGGTQAWRHEVTS